MKERKYIELFRSHSEEFQSLIEKGSFVADMSRIFNHTGQGEKNAGKLYFYSPDVVGATYYQEEDMPIWRYSAEVNLLDLRVKENRALLTEIIQMFIEQDEETRQSMLKHIPAQFQKPRMQSPTTVEDVINDNPLDGYSYWNQRATDFEFGVAMRKKLEELGYDGCIFTGGSQTDIALLNPATFEGRYEEEMVIND